MRFLEDIRVRLVYSTCIRLCELALTRIAMRDIRHTLIETELLFIVPPQEWRTIGSSSRSVAISFKDLSILRLRWHADVDVLVASCFS